MINDLWYKNAIIYCLSVETFMDSNGDGIGDFQGHACLYRVIARRERHAARPRGVVEGLLGIEEQVDHDLLQLRSIGPDARQIVGQLLVHHHVVQVQCMSHQLLCRLDYRIELDRCPLWWITARQS